MKPTNDLPNGPYTTLIQEPGKANRAMFYVRIGSTYTALKEQLANSIIDAKPGAREAGFAPMGEVEIEHKGGKVTSR